MRGRVVANLVANSAENPVFVLVCRGCAGRV